MGIFNYEKVDNLLGKIKNPRRISEIDNMALTAILSTHILHSCFVEKTIPILVESELILLDNIVYDNKYNYA